jgi:NADPH-dependent curcumin reductase CurA
MGHLNRQWLLREHPQGQLQLSHFARSEEQASPTLREGEVLVRTSVLHCAPTIRNALNDQVSEYTDAIPLGTVIRGPVGGRVVESRSEDVPVGSRILTRAGWQDYSVVDTHSTHVQLIPSGTSLIEALGPLGLNSLTAYFGVTRIGQPKPGEVMVVSGAAGSTGSVAAQIGKILGCRVIGIAGGSSKCEWLVDELGLDAAIDYKSESVAVRLAELCPEGVDVFYDNVGGQIFTDVFANLARFARVVVCGQIAQYDRGDKAETTVDTLRLIYGAITVRGFVMRDYAADFDAAGDQIAQWIAAGRLKHREDVREGFEKLPEAFQSLFDGSNQGTLLVVIDDDARARS